MKVWGYVVLAAAIVIAAASIMVITGNSISDKTSYGTIKIGVFVPLTGPLALQGNTVRDGLDMAHSQRPQNIELVFEDDRAVPQEAVKIATKFMETDGINILIGASSGSTLAVAPLAGQKKALLASPLAATPSLTSAGDYVFRTSSSSDRMAQTAAKILKEKGINRVAVLHENIEYTTGWKNAFVKRFEELGGAMTGVESFEQGANDVRSQLIKLKESNPDAIFLMAQSTQSARNLLKQHKELGIEFQLIGTEVFGFKDILREKDLTEGMLVLTYKYDLNSMEMKSFLAAFKDKYGRPMEEEVYGALAYDLYNIFSDAIEICSDDTECIKNRLYAVQNYKGASGTFSIDSNGDAMHDFVLRKAENGILVENI